MIRRIRPLRASQASLLFPVSTSGQTPQHPQWDQGAPLNCTLYADYKETIDTRRDIDGWMTAGFDDSAWAAPQVIGAAAKRWGQACAALTAAMRAHLYDPSTGRARSLRRDTAMPCGRYDTALLVWCGALEPWDGLFASRNLFAANAGRIGSPFHGFFVLDALFDNGEDGAAADFMRRFWGAMLDLGATTFYEHYSLDWAANSVPERQNSQCHGWSAAPAYALPARVLGVRPLAPGFTHVLVEPQTAGLAWAAGVVPTPAGAVRVSWQRSPMLLRVEIDAPQSCGLVVSLPATRGRMRAVIVDGKETAFAWRNGRQAVECAGGRHAIEQAEPSA